MKISDFSQVREDGKVISIGMTVRDMLAKGWMPSKVVLIKWEHCGELIHFSAPHGVHAIPVSGGEFIAAILDEDTNNSNARLTILSANGSIHGGMENRLMDSGRYVSGRFVWFETAMIAENDQFGVVFQSDFGESYRCDVDARHLLIVSSIRIK